MSGRAREPGWADVLEEHAVEDADRPPAGRAAARLRGRGALVLPAARALGARRRRALAPSGTGRPPCAVPPTAPRRRSRGLEGPLGRLLELEPERARAAPGTASRARPSCGTGSRCSTARACVSSVRVAQAYLELAVSCGRWRASPTAARMDAAPDRSSLWAGLFDLRENLLGRAVEDLKALAA